MLRLLVCYVVQIMSAIRSNEMQAGVVSLRGAVCSGRCVPATAHAGAPRSRLDIQYTSLTGQQCCFAPRNTAQCAAGNSQLTDALHCLAAVACSSVMMPGEYFDPNERMLGRLFETTARIGVLPGAGLK